MRNSQKGRVPVWALVREARRRAGLTRAELAERAGTSRAAVTRYETAVSEPTVATLDRLVRACGLELRLELAAPDPQRLRTAHTALRQTVEQRLEANDAAGALVVELREPVHGGRPS